MSAPAIALPAPLRAAVDAHQQRREKTTADRSLARRLQAGVAEAGLDVGGLAFYVHDGAVSMYGTVRDAEAREALLAVVTTQPGVRRVVDHLRFAEA